tara:strand:- start:1220 stop:1384 length:165 start_codon:yes stop_codon:yes gene_type:complete
VNNGKLPAPKPQPIFQHELKQSYLGDAHLTMGIAICYYFKPPKGTTERIHYEKR